MSYIAALQVRHQNAPFWGTECPNFLDLNNFLSLHELVDIVYFWRRYSIFFKTWGGDILKVWCKILVWGISWFKWLDFRVCPCLCFSPIDACLSAQNIILKRPQKNCVLQPCSTLLFTLAPFSSKGGQLVALWPAYGLCALLSLGLRKIPLLPTLPVPCKRCPGQRPSTALWAGNGFSKLLDGTRNIFWESGEQVYL